MADRVEAARRRRASRAHALLPGRVPRWLWQLELLSQLARRRALAIRLAFPLALVVPLVTTGAPPFFAGMLLVVLVTLIGTVGTGVGVTRARASGWLDRLAVLPLPAWRVSGELFLAAFLVDAVQGSVIVAVVAVAHQPGPALLGSTWALVLAVLALANALGLALAALTDHPGEIMLYLAVLLAPLLFLSGLFTGVPAQGVGHVVAGLLPFSYLHQAFELTLGGNPATGDPGSFAVAAAITAAVAVAATAGLGPAILRRSR